MPRIAVTVLSSTPRRSSARACAWRAPVAASADRAALAEARRAVSSVVAVVRCSDAAWFSACDARSRPPPVPEPRCWSPHHPPIPSPARCGPRAYPSPHRRCRAPLEGALERPLRPGGQIGVCKSLRHPRGCFDCGYRGFDQPGHILAQTRLFLVGATDVEPFSQIPCDHRLRERGDARGHRFGRFGAAFAVLAGACRGALQLSLFQKRDAKPRDGVMQIVRRCRRNGGRVDGAAHISAKSRSDTGAIALIAVGMVARAGIMPLNPPGLRAAASSGFRPRRAAPRRCRLPSRPRRSTGGRGPRSRR